MGQMNLVETLSAKVQEQSEEIQRLRDENNRLKGEQGKPKIKANKPALDVSSETERNTNQQEHPHALAGPSLYLATPCILPEKFLLKRGPSC